jgi:hypothetical protein
MKFLFYLMNNVKLLLSTQAPEMAKMNYLEKLKDPRWQKKRLIILKRDKFKCRSCENENRTLHIHHLNYSPSGDPWAVKNIDLITLCDHCHQVWTYLYDNKENLGNELISLVVKLHDDLEFDEIMRFRPKKNKLQNTNSEEYPF